MFEVAYNTLTPPTRTIKKTYMDQVESRTTHPRSLEDRRAASRQSDRVPETVARTRPLPRPAQSLSLIDQHRTDDAFRKPAINIPAAISGGLVGEELLTHGPSDMQRERQAQHRGATMRWMLSDIIFKRRSIGETKVHSRSDVLKLGFRGTQNGFGPLPSSGKVRPRPCRQTTPGGSCVLKVSSRLPPGCGPTRWPHLEVEMRMADGQQGSGDRR